MLAQDRPVGFFEYFTADGGAAGQIADIVRVIESEPSAVACNALMIDAEQQQTGFARLGLDPGVGREGGGQTGKLGFAAQLGIEPIECVQNAGHQVVMGGQRLGGVQNGASVQIDQDGIGRGAAGVDANADTHGMLPLPVFRYR